MAAHECCKGCVVALDDTLKRAPRTAIKGLWLASAYTRGGGFTGAMVGGAQAAWEAMKDAGIRARAGRVCRLWIGKRR